MTHARTSGILLHPSSLPGRHGAGDFGAAAYHFIDWLVTAGQRVWQILPLGPLGPGQSPYMSPSAFGLNPLLIDPDELAQRDLIDASELDVTGFDARCIDYPRVTPHRMRLLGLAAERFFARSERHPGFAAFCDRQREWLDDYALFMTIGEQYAGRAWQDWPRELAFRESQALHAQRTGHPDRIRFWQFIQWTAARQWHAVKRYASDRGVRIIGDMPIFVDAGSADVWSRPELFELGADLRPDRVAGVPPDYFSATGQRWGNPLYDWPQHRAEGFGWWIRRLRALLEQVDLVRVDHFRGFAAGWVIDASAPDARDGEWLSGPGTTLFEALRNALGGLPIIAEDLGYITDDVVALRERFGLPGMRVLQFAFAGDASNPYLPHNYEPNTVAYTGTHDNDTTRGWFAHAPEHEREAARRYLNCDGREIEWNVIHAASSSVARTTIYPFQDILGLGSEARMNTPALADGCWTWRFDWNQVHDWHARRLRQMSAAHGRADR